MEASGAGLFKEITSSFHVNDHSFLIVSGKGNNGGDGIVLARYLKQAGAKCRLYFPVGLPTSGPSNSHLRYYETFGYSYETDQPDDAATVIIDALLGAGTKLPLSPGVKQCTDWINAQKACRLSIDLPTGAASDSGHCDESVI